ncbi:MAG: hypothetical protein ACOVO1_11515 [Chitinophagaceae bacterium]
MQKQLYGILKFIGILLLILFCIDTFFTSGLKKNNTKYFGKLNKICKKDSLPQIAVFSSSVGEMGFNCRVLQSKLNKSAYNFSLSGTRFMQYKGLINEINDQKNNVEIVVMAEVIFSLEKMDAITDIGRFMPYISNENIYKSLHDIQPDLAFKSRYIPFYKYIAVSPDYYLQSVVGWKSSLQKKKPVDTLLGQIAVNRKWEADQDSIWKYAKPIPILIDSNVLNIYKKTIEQLVVNGKKVVITIPPIYMPKGQKIVDLTEFRKTLKQIACDNKVVFWDFSESMVDKQYFYNVQHLNAIGAAKFSEIFADSLKTIL